jgi:hypothetical protein
VRWCAQFFHKVSLLSGGFGYFWSNLTLVLAILTLAALHAVISMLPSEIQFVTYSDLPSYIPLLNLGFVYLFALIVQYVGDRGIKHTLVAVVAIIGTIPLTLAKMKTHQYFGHRGLGLGLAKYVGTGRDLATKRVTFLSTYQRYLYSHLAPGLDLLILVLVVARYNTLGVTFFWNATLSLWIVMVAWLFAPTLYNPFAFDLASLKRDYIEWSEWVRSAKFEDFYFGQKAGQVGEGDFAHNSWWSWLNAEPFILRLLHSFFRLAVYGTVGLCIFQRIVTIPNCTHACADRSRPSRRCAIGTADSCTCARVRRRSPPVRDLDGAEHALADRHLDGHGGAHRRRFARQGPGAAAHVLLLCALRWRRRRLRH